MVPTKYQLGEGLSFCEVDDTWIFLDRTADRYFKLGDRLDAAMRDVVEGRQPCLSDLDALVEQGVLTPSEGSMQSIKPITINVPLESVLDDLTPSVRPSHSTKWSTMTALATS